MEIINKSAKIGFLLAGMILTSFTAQAVDLGKSSPSTPYDRYMGSVKSVLKTMDGDKNSLDHVRKLMRQGRSFRYSYTEPYIATSPEVTAARRAGDCKAKALWLCSQLDESSVRYVIGKARAKSKISHAWVYWKDENSRWWILDCTNMRDPIPADKVSSKAYIPQFSYSKNGSYRHVAGMQVASSRRSNSPVASN